MHKFKILHPMNDFIAVVRMSKPSVLEIENNYDNEGVVVGIGPKAADSGLKLGERVILTSKQYTVITPESGDYVDCQVIMPRVGDILLKKPAGRDYQLIHDDVVKTGKDVLLG